MAAEYALSEPDAKITPDADNLVLNAPLWQTECDADPFTTIDSNTFSCALGGGAASPTWSNQGYIFDGGDKITTPDVPALYLGTNHSQEFWVLIPADIAAPQPARQEWLQVRRGSYDKRTQECLSRITSVKV